MTCACGGTGAVADGESMVSVCIVGLLLCVRLQPTGSRACRGTQNHRITRRMSRGMALLRLRAHAVAGTMRTYWSSASPVVRDAPVPRPGPCKRVENGMVDAGEPVSFGELVRQYRLSAGLTQAALAERAGISLRAIQDLERCVSLPQR